MDDINTASRWRAPGRARLWAKGHGKVNQWKPPKDALKTPNCQNPEPVTQASHERSRPKAAVPPWRRKTLRKRAQTGRPTRLARPRRWRRWAGSSLWLAYGFGGARQSAAPYPKTP